MTQKILPYKIKLVLEVDVRTTFQEILFFNILNTYKLAFKQLIEEKFPKADLKYTLLTKKIKRL